MSIYCNMEKIIYVYTQPKRKEKGGALGYLRKRFCLPWPVACQKGVFLDMPLGAYAVGGVSAAEIRRLLEGKGETGRGRLRLARTLRGIKRRIQKENGRGVAERALLLYEWDDWEIPLELALRFYRFCQNDNLFVLRAEQLILLDGWEEAENERDPFDWRREAERGNERSEIPFLFAVYQSYNYVTVVTKRPEAWRELEEEAYEEYGLSIRCVNDDRNLMFREKKTLIVDMGGRCADCCRNFPKESIYMDLHETPSKRHGLLVKCGKLPRLSLHNALDTILEDTV